MSIINEVMIPDGYAGTEKTISEMWRLVNAEYKDPHLRNIALAIIDKVPPKDYFGEANAIFKFVKEKIRYTRDPAGAELIQDPFVILEGRSGDCDDHAILLASLAKAIGIPARFRTVKTVRPSAFNHVHAEFYISGKGWLGADTTEKESYLGWRPGDIYGEQFWQDPMMAKGEKIMSRIEGLGRTSLPYETVEGLEALSQPRAQSKWMQRQRRISTRPTPEQIIARRAQQRQAFEARLTPERKRQMEQARQQSIREGAEAARISKEATVEGLGRTSLPYETVEGLEALGKKKKGGILKKLTKVVTAPQRMIMKPIRKVAKKVFKPVAGVLKKITVPLRKVTKPLYKVAKPLIKLSPAAVTVKKQERQAKKIKAKKEQARAVQAIQASQQDEQTKAEQETLVQAAATKAAAEENIVAKEELEMAKETGDEETIIAAEEAQAETEQSFTEETKALTEAVEAEGDEEEAGEEETGEEETGEEETSEEGEGVEGIAGSDKYDEAFEGLVGMGIFSRTGEFIGRTELPYETVGGLGRTSLPYETVEGLDALGKKKKKGKKLAKALKPMGKVLKKVSKPLLQVIGKVIPGASFITDVAIDVSTKGAKKKKPAAAAEAPVTEPEAPPETGKIFGLPKTVVYVGAGLVSAGLAGLIYLAARKKK